MRKIAALALAAAAACDPPPRATEGERLDTATNSEDRAFARQAHRVAVLAVRDTLYTVCVAGAAGRVDCARALLGERLERVAGLDGSRGVSIWFEEVCGISASEDAACVSRYSLGSRRVVARHAVALGAGNTLSCVLVSDGDLACWGYARPFDLDALAPRVVAQDVSDFAAASTHIISRGPAGLACLGPSYYGECSDGAERDGARVISPARGIAVARGTTCALRSEGVWCWGDVLTTECHVECLEALEYEAVGCREPQPRLTFAMPPGDPFERVDGGRRLLCGLTTGGELYCGPVMATSPRNVAEDVDDFAVAGDFVCYTRLDGTLTCETAAGERVPWDLSRLLDE